MFRSFIKNGKERKDAQPWSIHHFGYMKKLNCSPNSTYSFAVFEKEKLYQMYRIGNSLISFSSNLLVFCEQKWERAISSGKSVNRSCCSIVMSDLSELLTVALLSWATWPNHSWLLFYKKRWEQIAQVAFFKRANEEGRWERFALELKRGKTVKTYKKYNIFEWITCFFASNLLKSWANHSHCSFLKSDESKSLMLLFCKEWHRFGNSRITFLGESLVFCAKWANERLAKKN